MMDRFRVLLVFLLGLLGCPGRHAARVEQDLVIEYGYWSPDCVERIVITVNGQYPGPVIRAVEGDSVVVRVKNGLQTEGITVHWHGIRQEGSPWMDGVAYISQCPISPGEIFTYSFVVDNAGTYMYHGHYGMQRAQGFYGSLLVDPKPSTKEPWEYNEELNIILDDWFHLSVLDQQVGLVSRPFRWMGEPESLLIQGRGAYDCSRIPANTTLTCNSKHPQCSPYVLQVKPGKTYLLRIISAASLSTINFLLEGHTFTVVEADGHNVEPVKLSSLDVYSGQSYSLLFTANQDPSKNYWAASNIRGRRPVAKTGLAVLNYYPNSPTSLPKTPAPTGPLWNDFEDMTRQSNLIVATKESKNVPSSTHRRLELLNTQNYVDGQLKWALNNISYAPTSTPVLPALKYDLQNVVDSTPPPDRYAAGYDIHAVQTNLNAVSGSGVYTLALNSVIDVVLQNARTAHYNNSEVHPWHLHGHDFWVLGYGKGAFDIRKHERSLNLLNPPLRNTVPLFPFSWTAIRFRADNPGVWLFHCHLEAHLHMGMAVVFAAGVRRVGQIPPSTLGCGATRDLLLQHKHL